MEEKILVPLDGSKIGEAALPCVYDLIDKLLPKVKVEVTLIQVLAAMSHYIAAGEETARVPYTAQELEQMKERALLYLKKIEEEMKKSGASTRITTVVGDAADEIIQEADKINADIIAMSSHGRSGISRWAFGSVTDKVLRGGTRPILVIKSS
ncbi:universal stress protein [Chloroflexota bacterium]